MGSVTSNVYTLAELGSFLFPCLWRENCDILSLGCFNCSHSLFIALQMNLLLSSIICVCVFKLLISLNNKHLQSMTIFYFKLLFGLPPRNNTIVSHSKTADRNEHVLFFLF